MAGVVQGADGEKMPLGRRIFKRAFVYLLDKKTDAFFRVLRRRNPVLVMAKANLVLVTRFHDVEACLANSDVFKVGYGPRIDAAVGCFMLGNDNAENAQHKAALLRLLSRHDSQRIRDIVTDASVEKLSGIGNRTAVDMVSDYSRYIPMQLVKRYFGFTQATNDELLSWSRAMQHDIFHNRDSETHIHQRSVTAGQAIRVSIRTEIARRKKQEAAASDDILARLLRCQNEEGNGFDDESVVTDLAGLLVGAIETTSFSLVNILQELLARPDVMLMAREAAAANRDALLHKLCRELLRLRPMNALLIRQCAEDYAMVGVNNKTVTIPAGSRVLLCTGSAMKDEDVVAEPNQFRLDRPDGHYFIYGSGSHLCLGDKIADIMLVEMIKPLLLLRHIEPLKQPDFDTGPFPEHYLLALSR
ncbi:Vitamin D(3) 25-hydroxylase [Sinobacterium norvegicum]|uniref:Vitamin D(3) 25-hydroxylase n=1 Tax=Sinobacterium norvegicum TaxID=1641715 RepID=A0ABM9ABN0_9GAMM|nr:cytochrome P450 [Sinobacterium norvegicum]CAH0990616.1 Vitamin D(3) 25-hydroxylase [Sinobacterium norvegicum]